MVYTWRMAYEHAENVFYWFALKMNLANIKISRYHVKSNNMKDSNYWNISKFFSKYFSQNHDNLISDNLMSLSRVINHFIPSNDITEKI